MLTAIASGYLVAALAPFLARALRSATGPVLAAVPAYLLAYLLQFIPEAAQGRPWRFAFPWGGPGGLEAVFSLDALALMFSVMIALLAIIALIATGGLTLSPPARGRLMLAMLSLTISSLGFVLADTPVLVMGFAVLATLSVFLLLTSRRGAVARAQRIPVLVALLAGDLMLIAALVGLFTGSGAAGMADLIAHGLPNTPVAKIAAALLIAAGLVRLILIPADLRASRSGMTSEAASLLAQAGAYIPLMLYVVLRFVPALGAVAEDRLMLGIAGAVLLVAGAVTGFRARRFRTLVAGVTLLFSAAALIHLASFSAPALGAALLLVLSHAFSLAVLLIASQLVSRGNGWLDLDALKSATRGRPVALVAFGGGILSLAGVLPSLPMLTMSQSLQAGLAPRYNPAEIVFAVAAQAILIGLALLIGRNIWRSSAERATGEGAIPAVLLVAGILAVVLLIVPGWYPLALERLFVAAVVARSAVPVALGPFWPQGIAIGFAVAALVTGGALAWFEIRVKRTLDWCAPALPRRPERFWRQFLSQLALAARRTSSLIGKIGYRPIATVLAAIICIVFVWLAAELLMRPSPPLSFSFMPLGALALAAAAAAIVSTLQPSCERLVAVVSIASLLAALVLLAEGAPDLAYLLILLLVLETAILLVLSPRVREELEPVARPHLRQAIRIGLAVTSGIGASLTAIAVSHLSLDATTWTKFDQVELWAGILALILVFGIIGTDLNRQRTRQP